MSLQQLLDSFPKAKEKVNRKQPIETKSIVLADGTIVQCKVYPRVEQPTNQCTVKISGKFGRNGDGSKNGTAADCSIYCISKDEKDARKQKALDSVKEK